MAAAAFLLHAYRQGQLLHADVILVGAAVNAVQVQVVKPVFAHQSCGRFANPFAVLHIVSNKNGEFCGTLHPINVL